MRQCLRPGVGGSLYGDLDSAQIWDERVTDGWALDDDCGVAIRKTVAEAMAGRTVTLTTVEVGCETEQVGGSGRHMGENRRAGNVGGLSRRVSARRCVRGDLVQAIVMVHGVGGTRNPS
jgi:hypothetical protein